MKRLALVALVPLLLAATGQKSGTQTVVDPRFTIKDVDGTTSSRATSVRLKNLVDHTSGWVNVRSYGAKGDGTTDDTAAIQAAIDAASAFGGGTVVRFEPGKTYVVTTLVPKPGAYLDLVGSTLKRKSGTNYWMLYDSRAATASPALERFGIRNGTLDGNLAGNATGWTSGGVTMSGWTFLDFRSLRLTGFFGAALNFAATSFVTIEDVEVANCGQVNGGGYYAYGLQFDANSETVSSNLSVRNFTVRDIYGFGAHFRYSQNFSAENLVFKNLTRSADAIGLTLTQAQAGSIRNMTIDTSDGLGFEINAVRDVKVTGVKVNAAAKRPLVTGDNGTGQSSNGLVIENMTTTNTGASGLGIGLTYINRSTFRSFDLDANSAIYTTASVTSDYENLLEGITSAANITSAVTYYGKFSMKRCSFANAYVNEWTSHFAGIANARNGAQPSIALANGATTYVDFSAILGTPSLTARGLVMGKLRVNAIFNNAQGTYHEALFACSNNGTSCTLGTVTTQNPGAARNMTIAADAANKRISITNSTGNTVYLDWVVEIMQPFA